MIQIGFADVGGTWQVAARTCEAVVKENDRFGYKSWVAVPGTYDDAKPILQASRDTRIEALELLPQLVADIQSKMEAKLKIIEEAKRIAAEL